jgi:hypothetical protein
MLYRKNIKDAVMTLRLSGETATLEHLSQELGPNLEVWRTRESGVTKLLVLLSYRSARSLNRDLREEMFRAMLK